MLSSFKKGQEAAAPAPAPASHTPAAAPTPHDAPKVGLFSKKSAASPTSSANGTNGTAAPPKEGMFSSLKKSPSANSNATTGTNGSNGSGCAAVPTKSAKKEPMVMTVPIPADKKAGESLGPFTTPGQKSFTASMPKHVMPGQASFHVLVDESKTKKQTAMPVRSVKSVESLEGKISLVQVPVPTDSKKGDVVGPFKSPSGKVFTVAVPASVNGDKITAIVDDNVKKGTEQQARALETDEIVQYVDVPKGMKEGDLIGMTLTPGKRDFPAVVPKGKKAGDKVPFLVKDADAAGGVCSCFDGLMKGSKK